MIGFDTIYNFVEVNLAANKAVKMLRASGQKVDPKLLPTGGVGYVEVTKTIIYPEAQIEFTSGGAGAFNAGKLEIGKTYEVLFDGVAYKCACFDLIDGLPVLGNWASEGFPDTGEPFVVAYFEDDNAYELHYLPEVDAGEDVTSTHTVAIYEETEIVHKIDPEFLPEGGVGYEETKAPLTFNGDDTGLVRVMDYWVKITDEVVDANAVAKIEAMTPDGLTTYDSISVSQMAEGAYGVGPDVLYGEVSHPALYIISGLDGYEDGTYFYCDKTMPLYVTAVEFAETIHTIDPKFLPGAAQINNLQELQPSTRISWDKSTLSEKEQAGDVVWVNDAHTEAFVRISDLLPEPKDLIGGTITTYNKQDGEFSTIPIVRGVLGTESQLYGLIDFRPDGRQALQVYFLTYVVYEDNTPYDDSIVFPSAGVWVYYATTGLLSNAYVTAITLVSKRLKTDLAPACPVIDLDEYGLSPLAAIAAGGEVAIDANAIFDNMTRGVNYLFRFADGSGSFMECFSSYSQYGVDGGLSCIGFSFIDHSDGTIILYSAEITRYSMTVMVTPLGS